MNDILTKFNDNDLASFFGQGHEDIVKLVRAFLLSDDADQGCHAHELSADVISVIAARLKELVDALTHPAHVAVVLQTVADSADALLQYIVSRVLNDDMDIASPSHGDYIFDGTAYTPAAGTIGKIACGLATIIVQKHQGKHAVLAGANTFTPINFDEVRTHFRWSARMNETSRLTEMVETVLLDDDGDRKAWYDASADGYANVNDDIRAFVDALAVSEYVFEDIFHEFWKSVNDIIEIVFLLRYISLTSVRLLILVFKMLTTGNVCEQTAVPLPTSFGNSVCRGVDNATHLLALIDLRRSQTARTVMTELGRAKDVDAIFEQCLQWICAWNASSFFLDQDLVDVLLHQHASQEVNETTVMHEHKFGRVVIPQWDPQYVRSYATADDIRKISTQYIKYCRNFNILNSVKKHVNDVQRRLHTLSRLEFHNAQCRARGIPPMEF